MEEKEERAGLRSRQKKKREASIIASAMRLISLKGYRNTSIEDIAREAEVGPATVYNYFGSKADLLLSALNREMAFILEIGEKALKHPESGAVEAVMGILNACFRTFSGRYDKQLLREFFVVALVEQLSFRKKIMDMDYLMMEQIGRMLGIVHQRGQLREDLDIQDATNVIYAITGTSFMAYVMLDDMTFENFMILLRQHIELVFKGFAP